MPTLLFYNEDKNKNKRNIMFDQLEFLAVKPSTRIYAFRHVYSCNIN